MSVDVLTSENSAAFYAEKLGLPTPEPVAEPAASNDATDTAVVESGKADDTGTAETGTDEQQKTDPDPQAKQKLNLRFSELSRQRDEAKALADAKSAEAKAEREARELAEKRAQELESKLNPPKAADGPGPKPLQEQFTDAFEYAEALAQWSTEKALHDRDQKEAEARAEAERAKQAEAFRTRKAELVKEVPNYDEIITASPVVVSAEVRDAILESDEGPRLLLHLAQNPDVAQRLAGMKVGQALREIGRLEVTVAKAASTPSQDKGQVTKPVAAAAEISRAPAPISPLKGSSSIPETGLDANGVFHGTAAQWRAAREAGKIK